MLELISSLDQAKKSNLVVFLTNRFDFEKYLPLWIGEKALVKIEEIFKNQKNTTFRIFLGRDDFEEIIFFFHLDISQDPFVFLWEHIASLPENLTFSYQKNNILLDSILLGKYEYDFYKTQKKEITFFVECSESLLGAFEERYETLLNILSCRDVVNKPSNDKTPDKYVSIIKNIKFKNIKVKVIEYEEIKRLWLGLLEAVGRASHSKPKLVILEKIVDKKLPTLGFVGKGITFDTWGLNIKTDDHMLGMKDDMAGSAALLYLMKNIDEKKLACNVVCALPIAENSIAWDAYRPGDILKSYSGKTVEITNTDAEWRLVLADGVSYISKNYTLESISTIATLTGACMVALGYRYAGVMGNNKEFIHTLLQNPTSEKYWELPLGEYFVSKTKGTISDLINYTSGVMAGSSMWGAFLEQFCLKWEKFMHLDIAWPSMVKEKYGVFNPGATGFWVDSLTYLLENYKK